MRRCHHSGGTPGSVQHVCAHASTMSESSTWKKKMTTTQPALRSCSSKAQNTWRPGRRETHGAGEAERAAGANSPSSPTRTRLQHFLDRPGRVRDVVESDDRHHEERGRSGAGAIAAARRAAASIGFALLKLAAGSHGKLLPLFTRAGPAASRRRVSDRRQTGEFPRAGSPCCRPGCRTRGQSVLPA